MEQVNVNVGEIYVAGGCFWGVETYFQLMEGILETEVGYANGKTKTTEYYELKNTGHSETVYLKYDKNRLSLRRIMEALFRIIDPTSLNRQGEDAGIQYRTGIYFVGEEEDEIKAFISERQKDYTKKIAVEVQPLKNFVRAEEYHQNYLKKNPNGYCHIDLNNSSK